MAWSAIWLATQSSGSAPPVSRGCACRLSVKPYVAGVDVQPEAEFYDLVAFGSLAENVAETCGKGDRLVVTGKIEDETWVGRDGVERTTTKLVADGIGPSGAEVMAAITLTSSVTEKQFMQQVTEVAHTFRWDVFHPFISIRSSPGFPDLVMRRPPRLVLAELKSERGKVTPAQQAWLDRLSQCDGVEVHTWRPSDWNTLVKVLR